MEESKKPGDSKAPGYKGYKGYNGYRREESREERQARELAQAFRQRGLTVQELRTDAPDAETVTTIALEPGLRVPKGNFGFVYAATSDTTLYQECLQAEASANTDVNSSTTHLRRAFEELAYYVFAKAMCTVQPQLTLPGAMALAREAYNKNALLYTPKRLLCLVLTARGFLRQDPDREGWYTASEAFPDGEQLGKLVFDLYGDASGMIHVGKKGSAAQCRELLKDFRALTWLLFEAEQPVEEMDFRTIQRFRQGLQESLIPLGGYFPINKPFCSKNGLELAKGCTLCVTDETAPAYYLLKTVTGTPEGQRDLEALHALWSASRKTPESVLLDIGSLRTEEKQYQLFRIMGRPLSLTRAVLKTLTGTQKRQLVQDMAAGIRTLHHFTPPMPHRALRPKCYFLYKNGSVCHAVLASFSTVKDEASDKTVFGALDALLQNNAEKLFLAPELSPQSDTAALMKADIYSLGQLISFIYTGGPKEDTGELHTRSAMLELVQQLTDPDPARRPTIDRVCALLEAESRPPLAYGAAACRGTRPRQEDILLADGIITDADDYALQRTASLPAAFAVLDGIGGAFGGAETARAAAEALNSLTAPCLAMELADYTAPLHQIFAETEQRTRQYMLQHGFTASGAAAAMVVVCRGAVYAANLGDSRVYAFCGGQLTQLSRDHCTAFGSRYELYQYFGASDEDTDLDPYIGKRECRPGDCLLLCTDGVTNRLPDAELQALLAAHPDAGDAAAAILAAVKTASASDNATALVLKLL